MENENIDMKKTQSFLKKYKFTIIFVIALIVLLIPNLSLFSDLKQFPSPIYGGDIFHQLGAIEYVKQGGNPFVSFATFGDSIPGYMPLYSLVVGNFAKLGFSAMFSMYIFAALGIILGLYSMFLLTNHIIKNKYYALTASLFIFQLGFPLLKYGWIVKPTVFVLFFYFLLKFFDKQTMKNGLIAGLFYGLNGLAHGTTFMLSSLVLLFGFFWFNRKINFKKFKEYFNRTKKVNLNYIVMCLVGFAISLIHWLHMFLNFGNFPNKLTEWGQVNYRLATVKTNFIGDILGFFVSFKDLHAIIFFIFTLIFILVLFVKGSKKFNHLKKNSLFFICLLILLPLHFFITIPLFGIELSPHFMWSFGSYIVMALIVSVVFSFFLRIKSLKKYRLSAFVILSILFLMISALSFNNLVDNNQWIQSGLTNEISPLLLESRAAILENTHLDDNFISTKEIGSSINSLTGRRFLSIRRNQHPLVSKVDQRELDLAIILYGNSPNKRKELLEKYSIDYFYWDAFWIQSEFRFDDSGQLVNIFDPILIIKTPEREAVLQKYNISYSVENMVLDSAKRHMADTIRTYDALLVYPYNWSYEPWHPDFNNNLEEVWSFEQDSRKLARLFKINY